MAIPSRYLLSGDFAKLCKTTKVTLRHYKNIGLLTPVYEGDNGYMYYDLEQFYDYHLIDILKKTGTPLRSIKSYMNQQAPSNVLSILEKQQRQLAREKLEIERMEYMITRSIENINLGLSGLLSTSTPIIKFFDLEHIIALPINEFDTHGITSNPIKGEFLFISVLQKYLSICQEHNLFTDYQTGAIITPNSSTLTPSSLTHFYTRVNSKIDSPYYIAKPAGHYLTLLHKGSWEVDPCYQILIDYIYTHKIKTTGNLYAYDLAGYLLNGQEKHTIVLFAIQIIFN